MSTSLTVARPASAAIVRPGSALAAFTPEDREIINNAICPDASPAELNYFLSVAGALGMNPLTREIHLLITESTYKGKTTRKVNVHAGIDGLRKRAMGSGRIRGIQGPEWADSAGKWHDVLPVQAELTAARVRVHLDGWDFPIQVVVHWDEYGTMNAKYYDDGNPKNNWAKMPRHMLGKVALSHALRSACPDLLAGVYSTDEIGAEEIGGFSVAVTDETGAKKTRTVPRPGNAPALAPAPKPEQETAEAVEGEVVEPEPAADEAAREALFLEIKTLLPLLFPGTELPDKIDWPLVMAYCANFDNAGKLGRKYPMFKEWHTPQLEAIIAALSDEWARRQMEPAPAEVDTLPEGSLDLSPTPEAARATVEREAYEEQQAAAGLGDPEIPEASF